MTELSDAGLNTLQKRNGNGGDGNPVIIVVRVLRATSRQALLRQMAKLSGTGILPVSGVSTFPARSPADYVKQQCCLSHRLARICHPEQFTRADARHDTPGENRGDLRTANI